MGGLIAILIFVVLLALPGFYIITRSVFPRGSKKKATWISIVLTVLLVFVLAYSMMGTI